MPFMFGFITLQVPAGLTLYWVTSNIFSLIQQYFITGWGSLLPPKEDEKATKVKREAKASDVKGSTAQKGKENGKTKRRKKKR
jgi:YidC/Oxa1 family membrane protein insertase